MRILTIKEPWASLILKGEKQIETRTWKTDFRGEILLHASKNPKSKISGCIFAVANLDNIIPMEKKHEKYAKCGIYPNAYSWFLSNIRPTELKKVKGKLGLWKINCELRDKEKNNNSIPLVFF